MRLQRHLYLCLLGKVQGCALPIIYRLALRVRPTGMRGVL